MVAVTANGYIYRKLSTELQWRQLPGLASDIAIGQESPAWYSNIYIVSKRLFGSTDG